MVRLWVYSCALLLLVSGCGGGGGSGSNEGGVTAGVANPTYHDDVAPILNDSCVVCHQAGGIAPFSLDSYAAVINADSPSYHINEPINIRSMPPFMADNSGSCNTFQNARWLSDDDIATIGNWVDQGLPEGTAPSSPLAPPAQLALDPAEVSATASMASVYSPRGNGPDNPNDDYRCFVIDPGITANKFLTAYEMKPGNNELVHHIILYSLKSDLAESTATNLDAIDSGAGYSCFGGSGIQNDDVDHVTFLAGWAPGINVTRFPDNTGISIPANRKMVMQVHYNLDAGRSGTDQTSVDLALADSVANVATVLPIADIDMSLAAGQASVSTNVTWGPLPAFQIHGVFPHMHTLGRQIRVDRQLAAGGSECVVDVPSWDFEWQQFFFYSDESGPTNVGAGDSLQLTCTYDTRTRTSPVTWGDGTQDEMCINFFYTTGLL